MVCVSLNGGSVLPAAVNQLLFINYNTLSHLSWNKLQSIDVIWLIRFWAPGEFV